MSDPSDLVKLYSGRILALAADVPLLGRLDHPDGSAMRRSPVCGSQVTVDVCLGDGTITEFAQDVKACALGQAAAAIVGQHVIGCTSEQIGQARDDLAGFLTAQGPVPAAPFADFEVLTPAIDFKNRHGSILLALEATLDACAVASTRIAGLKHPAQS
ncbi:MAG: iron-sulfur cluster assembly scaffold protein [Pseudomonadota bacterium]